MTQDDLTILEKRFYAYTDAFVARAADAGPYVLKQEHTLRVRDTILMLAGLMNLNRKERVLAGAAALVHDLGRFPQFEIYGSFSDGPAGNHGAMGTGVLVKESILEGIPRPERQMILRAVALHNRPWLPPGLAPGLDLLARLLRDADKIDIYRVMKGYYERDRDRQRFLTHNLPDDNRVCRAFVDRLMAGRTIDFKEVASLSDMILFQISMIYDVNFPAAIQQIRDMGGIRVMLKALPGFPGLSRLENHLDAYMETGASPN